MGMDGWMALGGEAVIFSRLWRVEGMDGFCPRAGLACIYDLPLPGMISVLFFMTHSSLFDIVLQNAGGFSCHILSSLHPTIHQPNPF